MARSSLPPLLHSAPDDARARHQLACAVAFDLSQIVQILMYASDTVQATHPPEHHQAALDTLGAQTVRLVDYVEYLRLIAALETGDLPLQAQRLDLVALSRQAHEDVAAITRASRIQVMLDTDAPVHAWADATVLRRVMAMLIHNAMRHLTRDERRITLQCRAHGTWVSWSCTDTGVGMAATDVLRINHRLDRLARGSVDLGDSLCMGLNSCARFAGALHGRLQITSAGQGHGTTLMLTLPAHAEATADDP